MGLKFNSKFATVVAGALIALMGGLGFLLYQNLSQWALAEKNIRHTREALRSSEEVLTQVLAAESAGRTFVITGNTSYLPQYNKAFLSMEAELRFLGRLERDHQSAGAAAITRVAHDRKAAIDTSILSRRTSGFEASREQIKQGIGTRLTAELRARIHEFQKTERDFLWNWELEARSASQQRDRLLTTVFLLVLLLALSALVFLLNAARRQRLAEQALSAEHARLQGVLDSATRLSIIATDMEGHITVFSAGAERMLGYSAAEMLGRTPADIHLPEEIETRGEELTRTLGRKISGFDVFVALARSGGYENREWTYVRKDGTRLPVELTVTPVRDGEGALAGFLGLATDISARKASQLQMRKLSAAVKASPTSIVITDADGYIEYANPKFFELTGYSEQETIGQNPRILASGKTPKGVYKDLWDTLLTGRVWQGELLNRKKNGELFWEFASISPVKDPHGTITNFVAVKQDITDSKLAQRETEKARDSAVELARLKSEFLANMSHEIRTPMNAIIGMTGLLLDTTLTAQQRDYVKTVNGAGEALLDIINDILDFSKIESGKLLIERMDFSLRETVEGTADLLASRAQAKEIELAYFIEDGVPPGLRGDQGRLRQVLLNLLGNAVKFTERGEVVLRVSVAEESGSSATLKFAVHDTGIGVPEDAKKNLFSVFTQADASTTRKFGGTGLGLSISKKLVELMGGRIGFESEYGRGSTFWFTLPFEKQPGVPEPEPPAADLAGVRVLVVDDNAANREIMARYLELWKMRHATAASGPEALAALRREAAGPDPFRLVLLDMQMPAMDGLMLAAEMKKDPALAGVSKVMMTSLGHEMKREELEAAGISACLGKPVRPLALQKKICQALASPSPAAEPAAAPAAPEPRPLNKYFRVLVAEDNTVNQKVTLKQLEKLGYAADVAANGLEAVEALKLRPYDLVLMDCQMPEMDGFQATSEIRRQEAEQRRTPIVAMTANAMQGDSEKCFAAGMDGYIPKPVRLEQLAEVLRQWDSPLDPFVIKDLRELAGPDNPGFLSELVGAFLGDLPGRLEAIRAAVAAGDAEALRLAAHSLKGSSGNIGAKRLQKLSYELEKAGKAGDLPAAPAPLAALEKEAPVTLAALKELSGGPGRA